MNTRNNLVWCFVLIVFVVSAQGAFASPYCGIGGKSIIVQEYWQNNRPFYAIANLTDKEVTVAVRRYNRNIGKEFQNNAIAAEWKLAANGTTFVPASILTLSPYVEFLLDGKPIGLLTPMRPNLDKSLEGLVRTESCMNYWGGGQDPGYWFEQSSIELPASSDVEITLILRRDAGVLTFGDYGPLLQYISGGKDTDVNRYILPLPLIVPTGATCKTLCVTIANDVLIIDSPDPEGDILAHRVKLFLRTPTVDRPTPVAIAGHRDTEFGNYRVTRMFVVVP